MGLQLLALGQSRTPAQIDAAIEESRKLLSTNPDSGRVLSMKALKESRAIAYTSGEIQSLKGIGIFHFYRGNYDSTTYYWKECLRLAEETRDEEQITAAINNLAIVYQETDQYLKALRFSEKSLKRRLDQKDSAGIGSSLNNIGLIYHEANMNDKAIEFHSKALAIRLAYGDHKGIYKSFLNLGIAYMELDQFDTAQVLIERTLKNDKETNHTWGVANAMRNLGMIYQETDRLNEAMRYYDSSLVLAQQVKDAQLVLRNHVSLAQISNALSDRDNVNKYLRQVSSTIENGDLKTQIAYYEILANQLAVSGNYKESSNSWNKHKVLKDSLIRLSNENNVKETEIQLYYELQEAELRLANEKEQFYLKKEIEYKRKTNIILGSLLAFTLLLLFLILRNYRLLRKKNV